MHLGASLGERRVPAAGWVGEWVESVSEPHLHQPPPPDFVAATNGRENPRAAAGFTPPRETSPAGTATIGGMISDGRRCWHTDPRSGAGAETKTERRTGSEIAEIRSDSVSSRQNRWAAMRRRASG